MGYGYYYKCRKCRHKYEVHLGAGMMFPRVYRRLLQDIAEGKYGEEWKALVRETPYAAVDADKVVYICSCGYWEMGEDITLFVPNEPESIPGRQFGVKTVAELGYVPYVAPQELREEYHILKRYYHQCSKCGKRMRKASDGELLHLSCPVCGADNKSKGNLDWD